jgi:hypothetical protein
MFGPTWRGSGSRLATCGNASVNTRRTQGNGTSPSELQSVCSIRRAGLLSLLLILFEGCASPARTPHSGQHLGSSYDETNRPSPSPREVQSEVMRFADRLISMVDVACQDLSESSGTTSGRVFAQRFKVEQDSSAVMIAAGLNPEANLLDMIVLVTLQRRALEQYWVPEMYGDCARPLLETYQRLEKEIWSIARTVLNPTAQVELAGIIRDWCAKNPDFRYTRFVPFEEFARQAGEDPVEHRRTPDSLFGLLFLDPLARSLIKGNRSSRPMCA